MTVKEITDGLIRKTGVQPLPPEKTCDKLMIGSLEQEVDKVAVTFMATVEVIRKAADMGAQLIITHEPTWFTGEDTTDWLDGDPVYEEKKALLERTGISVWRFHDHMHMGHEDGIMRGFDRETGWGSYRMVSESGDPHARFDCCYEIPETTLGALCAFFKRTLPMDVVQIVGDPGMAVKRVGVLPGGGSLGIFSEYSPMEMMRRRELDIIVCGEILEWRLPAYVRDACQLGMPKGILVLGHERSEEPGMKHLGDWMRDITGDIPVVFIDSGEPFGYL